MSYSVLAPIAPKSYSIRIGSCLDTGITATRALELARDSDPGEEIEVFDADGNTYPIEADIDDMTIRLLDADGIMQAAIDIDDEEDLDRWL